MNNIFTLFFILIFNFILIRQKRIFLKIKSLLIVYIDKSQHHTEKEIKRKEDSKFAINGSGD